MPLLTRKTPAGTAPVQRRSLPRPSIAPVVDRRGFLKAGGITAGLAALLRERSPQVIGEAQAQVTTAPGPAPIEVKHTVCSHCSVGCSVEAVVQNGVWIRQDTAFDSPINMGAHCAKGASVREHGHGEHRLRYPMKLVNGKYQRISWDQAINEVGDKLLQLRQQSGPDSVYWIGSSKHNNEQSYLLRKFVSMFGSNNCDHQARICHSTTV
ncbi:MAG: formate dehydrogenase, partial [Ramlibacter sp.]|nr:formate dehydrogenase [Ramlibacter sp.]